MIGAKDEPAALRDIFHTVETHAVACARKIAEESINKIIADRFFLGIGRSRFFSSTRCGSRILQRRNEIGNGHACRKTVFQIDMVVFLDRQRQIDRAQRINRQLFKNTGCGQHGFGFDIRDARYGVPHKKRNVRYRFGNGGFGRKHTGLPLLQRLLPEQIALRLLQGCTRDLTDKMQFCNTHIAVHVRTPCAHLCRNGFACFGRIVFKHQKGMDLVAVRAFPRDAADHKFRNALERGVFLLQIIGRDLFAGGQDDVFLAAPRDAHKARLVDLAKVACFEVAVLRKRRARCRFVAEIPLHAVRGLHQKLAGLTALERDRRIGLSAGVCTDAAGYVADGGDVRFGRTVGNEDVKACSVIEVRDLFGERRARRA